MQGRSEFGEQLERVRRGDPGAMEGLMRSCREGVRRQAHGMLGGREAARVDSSDLVQETMAQAFTEIKKFRGSSESEWMAWLRSILLAKVRRLRRHHRAQKRSVLREIPRSDSAIDPSAYPADAQLIAEERRNSLAAGLEQLPAEMAEIVVRRVFLRETFAEIAASLNLNPSTSRVMFCRAIRRLRDLVPDEFSTDRSRSDALS